jgi:hypothetical protein
MRAMKWFLALNEGAPHFAAYADMVKVAVRSARRHTRLEPVLLWDGAPNALTDWCGREGVVVAPVRWRLLEEYRRVAQATGRRQLWDYAAGIFLRTEVPRLCAERGWADQAALYTDCDVMFTGDPEPLLPDLTGRFFAAAPEEDPADAEAINSGVMLLNLPALRQLDAAFEEFMRRHMETCAELTDQWAYRSFFRRGWGLLPTALNWKPYWGENPDARIVHFHGPKPFLRGAIADGSAAPVQREMARGAFDRYARIWDDFLPGAVQSA